MQESIDDLDPDVVFNEDAADRVINELLNDPNRDPDDDTLTREEMAEVLCAGMGGNCNDGDDAIDFLADNEITVGRYGTGCQNGASEQCREHDFAADEDTTNIHVQLFLERLPKRPACYPNCYDPPVNNYNPPPQNDNTPPVCGGSGYIVLTQHINSATNDDGCRPPSCPFGRRSDGFCEPPASNDPPVVYVASAAPVAEDGGPASFTVALSHRFTADVTVDVSTADGTAEAGSDYMALSSQTTTIPAGQRYATVPVAVLDDTSDEPNEMFTLSLSNPTGSATLSDNPQAEATIIDDDPPPPVSVSISGTPTTVEGGYLDFTVSLDMTPTTGVSVSFRGKSPYYDGHPLWVSETNACDNTSDYIATDGLYQTPGYETLTWAAGDGRSKQASIITCDDQVDEADVKRLDVELYDPRGARIGTGIASGTITDNDEPSACSALFAAVTDATFCLDGSTAVTEGDDLHFRARIGPDGESWKGTVTITLDGGTATLGPANGGTTGCLAGVDAYLNRSQPSATVVSATKISQGGWGENNPFLDVRLKTCDDAEIEALETITATLTLTPRPGQQGTPDVVSPTWTATIIDNDGLQVYLDGPVSATEGRALNFVVRLSEAAAFACLVRHQNPDTDI